MNTDRHGLSRTIIAAVLLAALGTGCMETLGNGNVDIPATDISVPVDTAAAGLDAIQPGAGAALKKTSEALQTMRGKTQEAPFNVIDENSTAIDADGKTVRLPVTVIEKRVSERRSTLGQSVGSGQATDPVVGDDATTGQASGPDSTEPDPVETVLENAGR